MRMLFCTTANEGHFGPLVPLARAAVAAGHETRVAAPESFAGAVRRAGFDHTPFADAPADTIGPVMAQLPMLPFYEADRTVVREVFARIDAQAAYPGLKRSLRGWRPDVIVREPAEFGSLAVAEEAGVPHLQVAIGMTELSRRICDLVTGPLGELSRIAGLAEDVLSRALAVEPLLSPVPEVLDRAGDETYDPALVASRFRSEETAKSTMALPGWSDPDWPLVYVTFGSVTGSLPPFGGVFRQALDGLADLPVRVLLTVGRRVDISGIGAAPANARIEAWRPQREILPHAALVLGHGGFGTTMGALSAGVPQLVAPIFTSDQVINARHISAVGAGRAVAAGPDAPGHACREVASVLGDAGYRQRAQEVAAEMALLPPAREALTLIRTLAEGAAR